ncbi:MAG TPA: multifunctional oxoglutarate decarboxylase/oxoglutarate dehydrogenase thiamine pyrophosphate-binding subunit/dihydrolipoyllysine-residue succinyltransferase subunit [bacterium]|nr:multifunctional oxoglutarate decarboxylase/oxoglutarate dehydrogenase thiamine pyrophosphate-binding subunit/dihydrolipoyllysine-residue succinyltransferase subunit [bacterium]
MSDRDPQTEDARIYGPNAWLIEEKLRQFHEFPDSVGEPWRHFLEDRKEGSDNGGGAPGAERDRPAEPAQPDAARDRPAEPKPDAASDRSGQEEGTEAGPDRQPLRGVAARIVENMERSLHVPTATSVRDVAVRVLEENRRILNQSLQEASGRRVSFTHLIAFALVKALRSWPGMTASYESVDDVPHRVVPRRVNLGLAVDVEKKDGSRTLLVPNVKDADAMDFASFLDAYDGIIRKVRDNKIGPDDFAGTTLTLTNPGMIGTVHSIPRLMEGQGLIVGIGAIDYPAEFRSADPRTLASIGVGKIMTVTSTYDHRVIQGAESGAFLATVDQLLNGAEGFYEEIFESLGVAHQPLVALRDRNPYADPATDSGLVEKEAKVLSLINMYRVRGHLIANLNPLAREVPANAELDPEFYGLTVWDYDREFITGGIAGRNRMTLRETLEVLRASYCQTIGIEYRHIQDPDQKKWIQDRVEGSAREEWTDAAEKRRILDRLVAAESFEKFLHTKYVGHKRFSLEGAEVLIPVLDHLFTSAHRVGVQEAVIGMAHRGRLNVLANILGKSLERIFREFEGDLDPESLDGSGDVKYHLGAGGVHTALGGGELSLTLASNPSHLEAVDPVVEGIARAKQDERDDAERGSVLPVLIHGDAAFAGQGVVAETLNLSDLHGYRTGGTVHVVVNNGIGFTTSPVDARSTQYPTDVARMIQAPIFHVNGNDPEACIRAIDLALAFREEFRRDVVVDVLCYRLHGHNEGDEPSFTQPLMYRAISRMRPVRTLYTESLVRRGEITEEEAEAVSKDFRARLQASFDATDNSAPPQPILPKHPMKDDAKPSVDTGVSRDVLEHVLEAASTFPDGFHVHPKLAKQLKARGAMLKEDSVDWATGEALAFGSLLLEGTTVRLSGQDSRRGTFSQRHSVLMDQETGEPYTPLGNLSDDQGRFVVFDSLLSEFAVMGFEYGYSVGSPEALVLWEAQFGDFVNGAQVIIDQFLSSSWEKWHQGSGLVLLLPHGYEGQGPEHSSARLERFLTLCAMKNMRVVVPTTAAQYFHVLRRQAHQQPKKPLIVMTPKSLLRAPSAKSECRQFTDEKFHLLLDDLPEHRDPDAERLLMCSGKVAYDLMAFREKHDVKGRAVVRFEQLYPFPSDDLEEILSRYPKAKEIKWVQEEPMNMGAYHYQLTKLRDRLPDDRRLSFAGRPPAGSSATGSQSMHAVEQEYLVQQAFYA